MTKFIGNGNKFIVAISVLAVLASIFLSGLYFSFSYYEGDTVSYLFQARLFAQGRVAAEAPPDFGFSPSTQINILNGKWYSKYPFGNALALSLGVILGVPWLVPAIATGAALIILHQILREVYSPHVAFFGSLLALISPATLVMGAVWFSEAVSRLFVAVFLMALIRALRGEHPTGYFYACLAGLALGYVFNTRPLTALIFGLGSVGLWLYFLRTRPNRELLFRAAIFALPLGLMVALSLAWNDYLTGSPWTSTHSAMQPYDKLGFGPRGTGYNPDVAEGRMWSYTPIHAGQRALTKTSPAVIFNSLGWGYYDPSMNRQLVFPADAASGLSLWVSIIPLMVPPWLMLLPFVSSRRNVYDIIFLCFPILTLLAYSFFYWDGSTFGFTPTHTRYYSECTMFGFIPLMARGVDIVYTRLRQTGNSLRRRLAGLLLILLLLNTAHSYARFTEPLLQRGEFLRKLESSVREYDIQRGVIFVQGTEAPLGDYPFHNLPAADIVYFRLVHSEVWGLRETDWRRAYERYFQGRDAYLFTTKGELVHLCVAHTPTQGSMRETDHLATAAGNGLGFPCP